MAIVSVWKRVRAEVQSTGSKSGWYMSHGFRAVMEFSLATHTILSKGTEWQNYPERLIVI